MAGGSGEIGHPRVAVSIMLIALWRWWWSSGRARSVGRLLFVSASIASFFHLYGSALAFLETPTLLLVQKLQSPFSQNEPDPLIAEEVARTALVKISNDTFLTRYAGTSPLPRCPLLADLKALLGREGVRTVAVDFSLAPPARLGARDADPAEQACQAGIDALIDEAGGRLVLIYPFEVEADRYEGRLDGDDPAHDYALRQRRRAIQDWVDQRQKSADLSTSVRFGSSALPQTQGVVLNVPPGCAGLHIRIPGELPSFSSQIRARLIESSLSATQRDAASNELPCPPAGRELPIAMATVTALQYAAGGRGFSIDEGCDRTRQCLPADVRHVIFGGGYGREDRYLTPLGEFHGVDIHAAAVTTPPVAVNRIWAVLLDGVLGYLLGRAFGGIWRRHFAGLRSVLPARRNAQRYREVPFGRVLFSYPIVPYALSMLAVGVAAVVGIGASALLLSATGLWMSPVGMIIGSTLDSLIFNPRDQAQGVIEALSKARPERRAFERRKPSPRRSEASETQRPKASTGPGPVESPVAARADAAIRWALNGIGAYLIFQTVIDLFR